MLVTHTMDIIIETDEGNYTVAFNPSVPAGWGKIQTAIAKHLSDFNFSKAMAVKDKTAGAVYWLKSQAENAELFIEAIKISVGEDEFGKIRAVLYRLDVDGLAQICMKVMDAYGEYYRAKLKEGLEP